MILHTRCMSGRDNIFAARIVINDRNNDRVVAETMMGGGGGGGGTAV